MIEINVVFSAAFRRHVLSIERRKVENSTEAGVVPAMMAG